MFKKSFIIFIVIFSLIGCGKELEKTNNIKNIDNIDKSIIINGSVVEKKGVGVKGNTGFIQTQEGFSN